MPAINLASKLEQARLTLDRADQSHLLAFYDTLDAAGRADLLTQILEQDWDRLGELIESHVRKAPETKLPSRLEPPACYPAEPTGDLKKKYAAARELGERLLRDGRVAAFTVAGGQGTRLGWEGPKGTFPATPVSGKPLFAIFAEQILAACRRCERPVPWYIMTSPLNDVATRTFFAEHAYFGLRPDDVIFFTQGTLPSFSLDGKALLAAPGQLASNPDGHGGSLRALHASGSLRDMRHRGIDRISYFQVDNTLVRCLDPLFLGLHALDDAQMSTKVTPKINAAEKMGVLCKADGKTAVIEYSDLPDDLAQRIEADGTLRFRFGNLAIHILDVAFVESLNAGRFALPPHRAVKKVPYCDPATGKLIDPDEPNAVKLEMFVFDALPFADKTVALETRREEEFAPIKNAEGSDSPETAKRAQTERAAAWLEAAGVRVPLNEDGTANCAIELSPLTALGPEDLGEVSLPDAIKPGEQIKL